jgi:hypothetical protein
MGEECDRNPLMGNMLTVDHKVKRDCKVVTEPRSAISITLTERSIVEDVKFTCTMMACFDSSSSYLLLGIGRIAHVSNVR